MDKFEKFLSRYEAGEVPWDHELPPPELIALAEVLEPGRVLDLGCGYGRSCIYLAQKGWQADGVDFVELAINEANRRAKAIGVEAHINFLHNPVTDLPFNDAQYDLIVDIGCMHALSEQEADAYAGEVVRLLKENGRYLLFAHILGENEEGDGAKGIPETRIRQIFSPLSLEKVEYGTTQVEDKPAWNSGWFWYIKSE